VKLVQGGLVDLEFAIHVTQLQHHIGIDPSLGVALRGLKAAGLVDGELAQAHTLLTRLLIALRTISPHAHEPVAERRATVAEACGFADWAALTAAYEHARRLSHQAWQHAISAPEG
jgi:glutamate-ammonia-ligase adenylyltransferase